MFLLFDGSEVSGEQIKEAHETGRARITCAHKYGGTTPGISRSLRLDGEDYDTRGTCYSVWDETWTIAPKSIMECMETAWYSPSGLSFWESIGKNPAAELGRRGGKKGGRSRSPAKIAAARENGKKGGRPPKKQTR